MVVPVPSGLVANEIQYSLGTLGLIKPRGSSRLSSKVLSLSLTIAMLLLSRKVTLLNGMLQAIKDRHLMDSRSFAEGMSIFLAVSLCILPIILNVTKFLNLLLDLSD